MVLINITTVKCYIHDNAAIILTPKHHMLKLITSSITYLFIIYLVIVYHPFFRFYFACLLVIIYCLWWCSLLLPTNYCNTANFTWGHTLEMSVHHSAENQPNTLIEMKNNCLNTLIPASQIWLLSIFSSFLTVNWISLDCGHHIAVKEMLIRAWHVYYFLYCIGLDQATINFENNLHINW